jgi:hypothetical protein
MKLKTTGLLRKIVRFFDASLSFRSATKQSPFNQQGRNAYRCSARAVSTTSAFAEFPDPCKADFFCLPGWGLISQMAHPAFATSILGHFE